MIWCKKALIVNIGFDILQLRTLCYAEQENRYIRDYVLVSTSGHDQVRREENYFSPLWSGDGSLSIIFSWQNIPVMERSLYSWSVELMVWHYTEDHYHISGDTVMVRPQQISTSKWLWQIYFSYILTNDRRRFMGPNIKTPGLCIALYSFTQIYLSQEDNPRFSATRN